MRSLIIALVICFAAALVGVSSSRAAAPRYLFKVATLAPDGSVWITQFRKFAQEVKEKTAGEVDFRIYPGGIMGDDLAMYRKMRVGQLQGGGFTMTGIASIVPDFRVMALPFLFHSYQEVDAVRRGLLPLFRKRFNDKGLELLAMTEVGFVYTMSTHPIATTQDLKKAVCWVPQDDPLSAAFMRNLGISPVQLSIPDVLSSLQTGLINTVFNSLYGSIVLQWFTKADYVTDIPFGYAYGAFLVDKRKFDQLPPQDAQIVRTTAEAHFRILIDQTRKSNQESRQVLARHGVHFVATTPETVNQFEQYRQKTIDQLVGSSFSKEAYDQVEKYLRQSRENHPAEKTQ